MNNSGQVTLVLGGTGRTGSLVARKLAERGLSARTALRHGADVLFDWLTATIASGHGSRPNDDIRRVTGSPPASFADFAHRNARAWAVPAAHP